MAVKHLVLLQTFCVNKPVNFEILLWLAKMWFAWSNRREISSQKYSLFPKYLDQSLILWPKTVWTGTELEFLCLLAFLFYIHRIIPIFVALSYMCFASTPSFSTLHILFMFLRSRLCPHCWPTRTVRYMQIYFWAGNSGLAPGSCLPDVPAVAWTSLLCAPFRRRLALCLALINHYNNQPVAWFSPVLRALLTAGFAETYFLCYPCQKEVCAVSWVSALSTVWLWERAKTGQ